MLHRVLSHEEATVSTVGAAENYMTPSLGLGIDIVSLLEVEQEGGQKIQNGCTNITRFFFWWGDLRQLSKHQAQMAQHVLLPEKWHIF